MNEYFYRKKSKSKKMNVDDFKNNRKIEKEYPWRTIIMFLIFFFPVGFYMLYKRFTSDNFSIERNIKGLRNTGVILVGFGLLYIFMGITGQFDKTDESNVFSSAIHMLALFGGSGYVFLSASKKMRKKKKYFVLIRDHKQFSIDNIALAVGLPYVTVLKDLKKILDSGYFSDAYIDESQRKLVFPNNKETRNFNDEIFQQKVIKCKSCGANTTVTAGQFNECEYCGSTIESETCR